MSRRRWAYTMGGVPLPEPVEVSEDYAGGDGRMPLFTDRFMEGTVVEGPNGPVDIGSRTKRREYMQVNGLADYSDFAEHWKTKAKERANPRFSGNLTAEIAHNYDTLSRRK